MAALKKIDEKIESIKSQLNSEDKVFKFMDKYFLSLGKKEDTITIR